IPSTEEISPSRFPSKTNSFANLIEPLISTSFERLFLVGVSAITVVGCVTVSSSAAASAGGLSPDPASSAGGVCSGLWGINFFSTPATMEGSKSSVNDFRLENSGGRDTRVPPQDRSRSRLASDDNAEWMQAL